MFDSYGQVASPSRIDSYMEVIGDHFSTDALRVGIADAMREAADFPPGPGTVYRAVRAVAAQGVRDDAPIALRLVPWKTGTEDKA